ncbi:hypothetical protein FA15DRAFT_674815 [Coprinopsis marcescibilis]|uniref:Uncharacterized protein n=1 Tax=Coprinopsis marcescibilis TaxID=230819 RepID=A0A5C3KH01_COPMA|nr:hypothetical protein FA15DRAFT_674815 [Coprinopsis marcescibilis]
MPSLDKPDEADVQAMSHRTKTILRLLYASLALSAITFVTSAINRTEWSSFPACVMAALTFPFVLALRVSTRKELKKSGIVYPTHLSFDSNGLPRPGMYAKPSPLPIYQRPNLIVTYAFTIIWLLIGVADFIALMQVINELWFFYSEGASGMLGRRITPHGIEIVILSKNGTLLYLVVKATEVACIFAQIGLLSWVCDLGNKGEKDGGKEGEEERVDVVSTRSVEIESLDKSASGKEDRAEQKVLEKEAMV